MTCMQDISAELVSRQDLCLFDYFKLGMNEETKKELQKIFDDCLLSPIELKDELFLYGTWDIKKNGR